MVLPAVSVADVHTQLQRSPLYEIVQQIYNKTETENILPFKNAGSEAKSLEFLLTQIVTGKFNYDMSHAANEQLLCKHADIIELVKRNRTESFEEVVS